MRKGDRYGRTGMAADQSRRVHLVPVGEMDPRFSRLASLDFHRFTDHSFIERLLESFRLSLNQETTPSLCFNAIPDGQPAAALPRVCVSG